MQYRRLVGPERRGSFEDIGTATVFLVSLVLILAVGAVLFSGLALSTPPVQDLSQMGQSAFGVRRTAPLLDLSKPASSQPEANDVGTAPRAQTVGVIEATPTPTPQPQPTPTPTAPLSGKVQVANTGGVGAYIRRTPNMKDKIVAWPDRTILDVIGEDVDANGIHWKHVRDPKGNEGFVPSQYLVPAP